MHQLSIIEKPLSKVIHGKRLNVLKEMVCATFKAEFLTVTQLGRAMSNTCEKNGIKKSDRFLSNSKLQDDYPIICTQLCTYLISPSSKPWILVDWTKMPNKKFHVLRAALVASGRAITVYEEIHDEKFLGKAKVHNNFLQNLKEILPSNCHPIIVTDAGFAVPWFKAVLRQHWDYVGRVRGNSYYSKDNILWQKIAGLTDIATPTAKYIGNVSLTKTHAFKTNLYTTKSKSKGRHALTKSGNIRKDSTSKSKAKAAREPWCIVTSMPHTNNMPNKIIKIYQSRMQIEEGIRDLKSSKYGFGFEHMLSYKPNRILILLLLAQIAAFIAYFTGMIAEANNIQYLFQANSIKHRRVLSLCYLGKRIIKKKLLLKKMIHADSNDTDILTIGMGIC
jgi:hypothetical protein